VRSAKQRRSSRRANAQSASAPAAARQPSARTSRVCTRLPSTSRRRPRRAGARARTAAGAAGWAHGRLRAPPCCCCEGGSLHDAPPHCREIPQPRVRERSPSSKRHAFKKPPPGAARRRRRGGRQILCPSAHHSACVPDLPVCDTSPSGFTPNSDATSGARLAPHARAAPSNERRREGTEGPPQTAAASSCAAQSP
jgi:hypothetical protein